MIDAIKKSVLIAFIAAGFWLFVMKEMGTVPMGTLFVYLGLWLAVGISLVAVSWFLSPRRAAQRHENPFAGMSDLERGRSIGIIQGSLNRNGISKEDSAWTGALFAKYAPGLTQSQQMEQFMAYLKGHAGEVRAGVTRRERLHDGPAVVLARAERRLGFDVTRDGTSWFGGLPALGGEAWPLDKNGQPMTPLAQIDLTGLAEAIKVPGLPNGSSLAFFAALPEKGDWVGRVVRVTQPGLPTQPPGPLPPVMNHSFGGPMRRGEPGDHQRLYPRMAMQWVPISASGRTDRKAFDAEVKAALGPGREYNLSASLFKEAMPDPTLPLNRDSLIRFLHGARISLGSGEAAETSLKKTQASYASRIKGLTEKLASETPEREVLQARLDNTKAALKQLESILADFPAATRQLVEELETMEAWAQTGDRWAPLTEAEQAMLAPLLELWTASSGLGNAHLDRTYQVHRYMKDCVGETLLAMAVAEDGIFETLPEPVRAAINGPWRQPYDRGHHQMFGCPDSVQVAAEENEDARLLLQLQCDDIAGFHWGDAGVLQFWIRPADLHAGQWDRVYMTFEGH
jgi:Domain of unknown function (DUF1963)